MPTLPNPLVFNRKRPRPKRVRGAGKRRGVDENERQAMDEEQSARIRERPKAERDPLWRWKRR